MPIPALFTTAHIEKKRKNILKTKIQLYYKVAHNLKELLYLKN